MIASNYVGCPLYLRINQQDDGRFLIVQSKLEHKEHEISEKAFLKMRTKITDDQKEAVKAFLVTNPSVNEVAQFIKDLTGKKIDNKRAQNIAYKLKRQLC